MVVIVPLQKLSFYLRCTLASVALVIAAIISIILGIVPSFLGYPGEVLCISYFYYFKIFKAIVGLELDMDEKSKSLYNSIDQPVVYICNHQSTFDIALFTSVIKPSTRSITKKESFYIPFIGQYCKFHF
jgi:1-acyl-sn-glycerol-3-phosphate acyltransferase